VAGLPPSSPRRARNRCGGSWAAAQPCSPTSRRAARLQWIALLGRFGELTKISSTSGSTSTTPAHDQLADRRRVGLRLLPGAADGPARHAGARGLRAEWREAATGWAPPRSSTSATRGPRVVSSRDGRSAALFGNAFAAYATAYALVGDTVQLVPGTIQNLMSGNVLVDENQVGLALGVEMIVVIAFIMVGYALRSARRAWLHEAALPRRRPRLWRVTILVLAALYFLGPIAASIRFSLIQNNRQGRPGQLQPKCSTTRCCRTRVGTVARDRRHRTRPSCSC